MMVPFFAGVLCGIYIGTRYDCETYVKKLEDCFKELPKKKD